MRRWTTMMAAVAMAALPAVAVGALARPPEEACAYLEEEGLSTADRYREYREGQFYCWSLRRDLPAGDPQRHWVRYQAAGSADEVTTVTLDLRVVSSSEVQRAHKLFLGYVKALVKRAVGHDAPSPLDAAVMSARPGRWELAGAALVLAKAHVQGTAYNLIFRIE